MDQATLSKDGRAASATASATAKATASATADTSAGSDANLAPKALANAVACRHLNDSERSFVDCRQRLISYLVKLNHALDEDLHDLSQALLNRFCDALVDYLSAGHFQLFQRLIPAPHEYAAIESTTAAAMAFNDTWDGRQKVDLAAMKADLERLALVLGTRFELEDDILCTAG